MNCTNFIEGLYFRRELVTYCSMCSSLSKSTATPISVDNPANLIESVVAPYYSYIIATVISNDHVFDLSITGSNSAAVESIIASQRAYNHTHPVILQNHPKYFGNMTLQFKSLNEQHEILNKVCSCFINAPKVRSKDGILGGGNVRNGNYDAFVNNAHLKASFEVSNIVSKARSVYQHVTFNWCKRIQALVRIAPTLAWKYHDYVVPIIIQHTQPAPLPSAAAAAAVVGSDLPGSNDSKGGKPQASPEEVMKSYVS